MSTFTKATSVCSFARMLNTGAIRWPAEGRREENVSEDLDPLTSECGNKQGGRWADFWRARRRTWATPLGREIRHDEPLILRKELVVLLVASHLEHPRTRVGCKVPLQ